MGVVFKGNLRDLLVLGTGSGYGDGDGSGYGDGYGTGYGTGDGDGYGTGSGYGDGDGSGDDIVEETCIVNTQNC